MSPRKVLRRYIWYYLCKYLLTISWWMSQNISRKEYLDTYLKRIPRIFGFAFLFVIRSPACWSTEGGREVETERDQTWLAQVSPRDYWSSLGWGVEGLSLSNKAGNFPIDSFVIIMIQKDRKRLGPTCGAGTAQEKKAGVGLLLNGAYLCNNL